MKQLTATTLKKVDLQKLLLTEIPDWVKIKCNKNFKGNHSIHNEKKIDKLTGYPPSERHHIDDATHSYFHPNVNS